MVFFFYLHLVLVSFLRCFQLWHRIDYFNTVLFLFVLISFELLFRSNFGLSLFLHFVVICFVLFVVNRSSVFSSRVVAQETLLI